MSAAPDQAELRRTPVENLSQVLASLRSLAPSELLLVALLVLLILVSAVGNCLVCVAIFTDRRLRKLGNAFIVSLAVADLFVSCLVMTFALCNELLTYWIFGDWFCDLWISFDVMCSTASILSLCAISLDRFVHIKDCLLYNQWMTRRVAISAVIIIWFTSALVSIVPINLGWHRPTSQGPATLSPMGSSQLQHQHQHGPNNTALGSSSSAGQTAGRPRIRSDEPLELVGHKLNYWSSGRPIENQSSLQAEPGQSWANIGRADFVTAAHPAGSSGPPFSSAPFTSTGGLQRVSTNAHFNQTLSNPGDGSTMQVAQAGLHLQPGPGPLEQLPVCVLTLTPTYAVVSSAISFYIPCLIMLGLYTKLFACARRHVRNIQAISKVPAPLAPKGQGPTSSALEPPLQAAERNQAPGRARWLSFGRRHPPKPAPVESAQVARPESRCHLAPTGDTNDTGRASPRSAASGQTLEQMPFLNDQHSSSTQLADLAPASSANTNAQDTKNLAASSRKPATNLTAFSQQIQERNQQQQQQQSGQLATHKAAVTLGIIMGTFLFCWVPFFCLNVIKAFCVDCIPSSVFRAFTWLGYANSALNPIIYGIHNSEFRCAFNRIFFKHLNFKNSRYYLNRRLSFDLRHSSRFTRRSQTKDATDRLASSTRSNRLQTNKPDTLA